MKTWLTVFAILAAQAAQLEKYETQAKGIRIVPGQWRPHYAWEQIAWVSPSWPSQDYIWLDFPEAIFSDQGLLFLSHVNPDFPTLFTGLPKTPWREAPGGIAFERALPNGVRFGGSVVRKSDTMVELELHIKNGSRVLLTGIKLQTCAYLRAIREFSDFTLENKFVHVPAGGWRRLAEARSEPQPSGRYRIGWRGGRAVADLPVIATVSNQARRLVAMTWHEDTLSMISNPNHPCMHADPQFGDLRPGEEASIRGRLVFFEGTLEEFDYRAAGLRR